MPYRAFVWMQGHNYANFALPNVQTMLLRAIAWTGKRPIDALMTVQPAGRGRAAGRGTQGGVVGRDRSRGLPGLEPADVQEPAVSTCD